MAIGRIVRADMWSSPSFMTLSPPGKILFTFAIVSSDDYGRLKWDARHFQFSAFLGMNLSESEVEAAMAEVEAKIDNIRVYTVAGRTYAELLAFDRFQVLKHGRAKSIIPGPDGVYPAGEPYMRRGKGKAGEPSKAAQAAPAPATEKVAPRHISYGG